MKNIKQITALALLSLTITIGHSSTKTTNTINPIAKAKSKTAKKRDVKVALLLDTSNSMDGLINQAKSQLWDIVNELSYAKCQGNTPNLKIALYEYGNDNLSSREGYIRQVLGFNSDLDEISEKLFSLVTNGGSEFCGEVIQTSLNQLEWGNDADDLKLIFIAGNEAFDQGKVSYTSSAINAKEKDVVVNTIYCGNFNTGINTKWKHGAIITGGDYMAIDHNKEIIEIATPYDDIIIKLNTRLNKTYIRYGSIGASKMKMQAKQDANASELNEAVIVKRAVSKSSSLYHNKSWDLVDASKDKKFSYKNLNQSQLPSELRNKSTEELKNYISIKTKERTAIQEKIQELNKKRTAFISKNKKESAGEALESAMIKAIKKQAVKKNYTWN